MTHHYIGRNTLRLQDKKQKLKLSEEKEKLFKEPNNKPKLKQLGKGLKLKEEKKRPIRKPNKKQEDKLKQKLPLTGSFYSFG